ncbi:MAG: helix-turn-helix domain-containing protein [Kofleriaceae bacterium]|nr:helix-turn-helix domain-containing protein [Kofleriaceae bacterium]
MTPSFYPAVSAGALLAGFGALGFDTSAIRSEAHVEGDLHDPEATLPIATWRELIEAGKRRFLRAQDWRHDAVTMAAGLATPFGSFGPIDYLAGSAMDLASGIRSLTSHFQALAARFTLELEVQEHHAGIVTIVSSGALDDDTHEFTVATFIGRFRYLAGDALRVERVHLPRRTSTAVPAKLLGALVTGGASAPRIELARGVLAARLRTADPLLHDTMAKLAERLQLGRAAAPLELAVRARLRDQLPTGNVTGSSLARSLGMSTRTLHRRLGESGRTFQALVDDFRADESERLLLQPQRSLAEVALAVGYSDQSAWTRAFRRWHGITPSEWREKRQQELRP